MMVILRFDVMQTNYASAAPCSASPCSAAPCCAAYEQYNYVTKSDVHSTIITVRASQVQNKYAEVCFKCDVYITIITVSVS